MNILKPNAPETHLNLTKSAKTIKPKIDGVYSWKVSDKLTFTFSTLEKMENFKLNNPQYK